MTDLQPVLVVTALDDPTADTVIDQLNAREVPVVRFDAAEFPGDLSFGAQIGDAVHGWTGRLQTPTRSARLSTVRAVYYRRPSGFDFSHLEADDARFALAQARYGFGGVLANLPGCLYVNHPHAIADAEFKPAQLAVAAASGFHVPETLVTNDPIRAREFAAEHECLVYKPLFATPYHVGGQARTVWVKDVDMGDLDDSVRGTAHMFQVKINKIADLRVTVIGGDVFCVRIDSDLLDWRYEYGRLSYTVMEPPPGLAETARAYLARFGLSFGCFDFVLTKGGEPYFLECNPNGQWGWLEEETGLPMAAALADLLQKGRM